MSLLDLFQSILLVAFSVYLVRKQSFIFSPILFLFFFSTFISQLTHYWLCYRLAFMLILFVEQKKQQQKNISNDNQMAKVTPPFNHMVSLVSTNRTRKFKISPLEDLQRLYCLNNSIQIFLFGRLWPTPEDLTKLAFWVI